MLDFIKNIQNKDPVKPGFFEVVLCYPGVHAMFFHRCANYLYRIKLRILPRLISNISSILTGIEIHPAAKIGKRLFIDHGNGVVIGQTAIIGDDVTIYHGVTLGGNGKITDQKRHPEIGNNVILGAGAKLIGNIKIGDNARIGPNAVITHDVDADKIIVSCKAVEITRRNFEIEYQI